ncbi:hypothetical protein JCM10908_003410 [Rhodotorula pacifica]|uniref:Ula1p n=1 Tax=Rhodotorula pacifica TaxID=1495444 RepID=UPI00316E58E9
MASEDALPPPIQDAIALDALPVQSTSTSASRPTAHEQKYDRQLRLWAASGQSALEQAHILVANGNGTAASTLKNLVLPGIGQFTVLDPKTTDEADVGASFFLEKDSVGQPRAEQVVKFLLELNSDVKGNALVQSLDELKDLSPYSLILAVDVEDPEQLVRLADQAWERHIPLIKVESCGFYGSLRTQVNEITIVETHPESIVDLRLAHPFPALVEYATSLDYDSMDSEQHGHIPAVAILIKALEDWKAAHGGQSPTGSAERKQFTDSVLALKRQSDEENFDEAVTLYRRAGTRHGIPAEIQALFSDPSCENISSSSPNFWLLLHAVRAFTRHPSNPSHLLPLSGALPDMKATSSSYVTLQKLYKQKAREDLDLVKQLLGETLAQAGIDDANVTVRDEEVESFVKHAAWLKVVRGRSLRQEVEACKLKGQIGSILSSASFQEPPDISLHIYTALRASSLFYASHGRLPGTASSSEPTSKVEEDAMELTKLAEGLVEQWRGGEDLATFGIEEQSWKETLANACREVTRATPHSTLPQTSALLGGMVAQEAIKLITKQYVPLGATCIWDGIRSGTGIVDA